MARSRDPLSLTPNWHLDLRLEAELPEDNVVRTRFVVGAVFGTVAVMSLLLLAWVGYTRSNLRAEIAEFDRIREENQASVAEIDQLQKEYETGAQKIEKAAKIIKGRLLFSQFVATVAQSLPATMALDQVQLTEDGIKISGQVTSPTELSRYLAALRQNPKFTALFTEIKQTGYTPNRAGNGFIFDITFKQKPSP
jgi:Tfp pilus assembly protein PilN